MYTTKAETKMQLKILELSMDHVLMNSGETKCASYSVKLLVVVFMSGVSSCVYTPKLNPHGTKLRKE